MNNSTFCKSFLIMITLLQIAVLLIISLMSLNNKYYYIIYDQHEYSSNSQQSQLVKWNRNHLIELEENIEYRQYLNVYVSKLKGKPWHTPKNTKYQKVKPILEELFTDYYDNALRYINEFDIDEGEFYIIKHSRDWYQIAYYSTDKKDKQQIVIDFRDGIDDFMIDLYHLPGYLHRPNYRKKGEPINLEDFKLYLNLTLKFLSDHESYEVYLESFIKSFHNLASGSNVIEGFDITSEKAFMNIIEHLENRKLTIEKILIEDDNIVPIERERHRGEIDGIKYAIKTVNLYK